MSTHTTATAYFDDRYFEAEVLIEVWRENGGIKTNVLGHNPSRGLTGWRCEKFRNEQNREDCQRFVDQDTDVHEACRIALEEDEANYRNVRPFARGVRAYA